MTEEITFEAIHCRNGNIVATNRGLSISVSLTTTPYVHLESIRKACEVELQERDRVLDEARDSND